jgi:hypothetical protein
MHTRLCADATPTRKRASTSTHRRTHCAHLQLDEYFRAAPIAREVVAHLVRWRRVASAARCGKPHLDKLWPRGCCTKLCSGMRSQADPLAAGERAKRARRHRHSSIAIERWRKPGSSYHPHTPRCASWRRCRRSRSTWPSRLAQHVPNAGKRAATSSRHVPRLQLYALGDRVGLKSTSLLKLAAFNPAATTGAFALATTVPCAFDSSAVCCASTSLLGIRGGSWRLRPRCAPIPREPGRSLGNAVS